MRLLLILSVLITTPLLAISQYCPPLSDKADGGRQFHITVGYGITRLYGDVNENNALGSAGTIKFDYSFIKGLYFGLESQFGSLKTDAINSAVPRQSDNDYIAGGVVATIHPFEFFSGKKYGRPTFGDLFAESLFIGVGALYVINNYDYIYRDVNNPSTYGVIEEVNEYGYPTFKERTRSLVLPSLNFGTAFPLNYQHNNYRGNVLSAVLKAQINFSGNDALDGYTPYNSDGTLINSANDVYNFYSLGLRYSF